MITLSITDFDVQRAEPSTFFRKYVKESCLPSRVIRVFFVVISTVESMRGKVFMTVTICKKTKLYVTASVTVAERLHENAGLLIKLRNAPCCSLSRNSILKLAAGNGFHRQFYRPILPAVIQARWKQEFRAGFLGDLRRRCQEQVLLQSECAGGRPWWPEQGLSQEVLIVRDGGTSFRIILGKMNEV